MISKRSWNVRNNQNWVSRIRIIEHNQECQIACTRTGIDTNYTIQHKIGHGGEWELNRKYGGGMLETVFTIAFSFSSVYRSCVVSCSLRVSSHVRVCKLLAFSFLIDNPLLVIVQSETQFVLSFSYSISFSGTSNDYVCIALESIEFHSHH